jgi:hypothetical protein
MLCREVAGIIGFELGIQAYAWAQSRRSQINFAPPLLAARIPLPVPRLIRSVPDGPLLLKNGAGSPCRPARRACQVLGASEQRLNSEALPA